LSARDYAVIRSSYDALNARDVDAVLGHFTEDCIFDASRIMEGVYEGREAYRGFLERLLEATEIVYTPEEMITNPRGPVLVRTRLHGAGSSSKAPMVGELGFVYELEEALIHRQEVHPDPDELLRSAA